MIRKIDINSEEFQLEFEITKKFTDKVVKKFNLFYNPDEDINESIQRGLTRNQLVYGEKFCPCFMVMGKTLEEQKQNPENRLCPCTPALKNEIPNSGNCHCGIFCTFEKVNQLKEENHSSSFVSTKNKLTKEDCEKLLSKYEVSGIDLESLLEARKEGIIKFNLVDTREWMEWVAKRIVGTDYLIPTTSFFESIEQIINQKDVSTILYCRAGNRSAQCQRIMMDLGFKKVVNYDYGITTYKGEIEKGEI